MIEFGTSDVTDIFVGDKVVDKIYLGNDLKWQRIPPEEMLVFTAIDNNGKCEFETDYNGTVVEYMLGDPCVYYKYILVEPTPTTKSDYNVKYVYDETQQKYVQCTYTSSSDTLTPAWVEVGVTPAYTKSSYANRENYDERDIPSNYEGQSNNMFNYKYFQGLDPNAFSKTYSSSETPPTLVPAIGDLVIPDTYKGKPVTKIAGNAMSGYTTPNTRDKTIWYIYNEIHNPPTTITLSSNIKTLYGGAFYRINLYLPTEFVLNNKLETLNSGSLQVYKNSSAQHLVFSSTAQTMSFGSGVLNTTVGTITFNTNVASDCGNSGTAIANETLYAIYNTTVTSITGYISCKSGAKLVFMHGANDPITLSLSKAKSAITADIYTDNPTIQNYDWSGNANITPTFHPLSEYTGS